MPLSMYLVIAEKENWTLLWPRNFKNGKFKKNTMTVTEVVLIQVFLTVSSKQKIKMKAWNAVISSYHSKINSRESHFSLVWVMEFGIISWCLSKVKIFPLTLNFNLVDLHRFLENGKWIIPISNRVYTLFKKPFLLTHTALLKWFIHSIVRGS